MENSGIIVISGPSGVGKTTLYKRLLADLPEILDFSVSATTRKPRVGEMNGRDYHFLTTEEFQALIEAGEFVEWARVYQNYYGTLRSEISRINAKGKICLLDVDVQGGMNIRSTCPTCPLIFILPPDIATLERRITERNQDHPEVIRLRVDTAKHEVEHADRYDYRIVNDRLEDAYAELKALVVKLAAKIKVECGNCP
jgi:guanylate kinase